MRSLADVDRAALAERIAIVVACLLMAAWFVAMERTIAGQWGFSLDDSWIYATFARNVATGQGYAFNPHEPVGGATGPLYVFLLALFYLFFHTVVWPAKIFGVTCLAASGVLTREAARRLVPETRWLPLLAGLLVAISPPLVWGALSGLEQPVYLLLACLGLYFLTRGRPTASSLAFASGIWLRPDGVFLAFLSLWTRIGETARKATGAVLGVAALLAAYLAFNMAVGHSPLPTSVAVKAHWSSDYVAREWSMLAQWLWLWGLSPDPSRVGPHAPLLLPAIVVGSIVGLRRWPLLPLYVFGFPAAFALFGPTGGQHGRYIAYVIPFGLCLACVGIQWTATRIPRARTRLLVVFAAACLLWQVGVGRMMGITHGWNVQNINAMHRFLAEKATRVMAPGDTIAVNDVGAMGYFSGCYVVDLVGLESPARSFPDNLRTYKPKVLVVFPEWFEGYTDVDAATQQRFFWDPDSAYKYTPFMGVKLQNNTIASRNTMVLYERIPRDEPAIPRVRIVTH
ncbi:MAG: hypothetical protein ACRENN_11270 [Candidatus Eiseniibacteriota bacterium]